MIHLLLSRGADPNHVVMPSGDTAMHYVAEKHHVATVTRLAEAGASVTQPNIADGFTPIDCAVWSYSNDTRPNIFSNAIAVIMELKVRLFFANIFHFMPLFRGFLKKE